MLLPWLLLLLASLPAQSPRPLLLHHGQVMLNDGRGSTASALLVRRGRVAAVGRLEDVEKQDGARDAQRIDLEGATVVPGFQDAHGHLADLGAALETLDLSAATSYEDVIDRVRREAARVPEGTWVQGHGWDETTWPVKHLPHHALLSAQVDKHPVFLVRADGHAALVNRAALALAKLDGVLDQEPKVQGGRVLLDDEHHASGVLLEAAMDNVQRLIPPPDVRTRRRRIAAAQQYLISRGITCVHDMGTTPADLEVLKDLRAARALKLRVVSYLDGDGVLDDALLKDMPLAADDAEWLCAPGVFLRVDGALSTRGAALLEEYKDLRGERGSLRHTDDDLARRLAMISKHHLQPAVEANGDRATRIVLDAYERLLAASAGAHDLRPRIEGAELVSTKDWPRFPSLGVVPSMQPARAAKERAWLADRLGPRRTRGASFWRELAPELGRLAFGSDFPSQDADPLRGLAAASARGDDPDEASDAPRAAQPLDIEGALQGFTSGASWAAGQDERRGRLEVGYAADMTVLRLDASTAARGDLSRGHVERVIVNGEIVYAAH
jgi:predicted amidohydrolase YtcJ